VLGQALLTKRMGKTRVIAETGAGQHGVATATAARCFGPRVHRLHGRGRHPSARRSTCFRMRCSAPRSSRSTSGSRTLKDAINEALRDWVANVDHTHYLIGSVMGPHPFPSMVRDFQRVIGDEARAQCLELTAAARRVVACVGGGSNAIGLFTAFLDDADVRSTASRPAATASRPAGTPRRSPRRARRAARRPHLRAAGRGRPDHRVALDLGRPRLPGRRPEHAWLRDDRPRDVRAGHRRRGDGGVRAALPDRGHHPGDRVGARARRRAPRSPASSGRTRDPAVNLSGRGDKDMDTACRPASPTSTAAIDALRAMVEPAAT
jgi:tryptophan synthase beta chain